MASINYKSLAATTRISEHFRMYSLLMIILYSSVCETSKHDYTYNIGGVMSSELTVKHFTTIIQVSHIVLLFYLIDNCLCSFLKWQLLFFMKRYFCLTLVICFNYMLFVFERMPIHLSVHSWSNIYIWRIMVWARAIWKRKGGKVDSLNKL